MAPEGKVPADARDGRRSVRLATIEGVPWAIAQGVLQNFVVPCALALKAGTFQVGLLSAMPQLGAAAAQLKAPALAARLHSPRKALLAAAAVGSVPFFAMAVAAPAGSPAVVWVLLVLSTAALLLYHLPNAAWGTLVSALVPAAQRGRFLGVRSSIASLATFVAFVAGGKLLDVAEDRVLWGFAAIFAAGGVARLASFWLFSRMSEPPGAVVTAPRESAAATMRGLTRSNMGRFLLWYGAIMASASISGPFFAVYMIRDLEFSYATYTLLSTVPSITSVVAPLAWGRLVDSRGNVRVLRALTWGISVIPLLWLASAAIPWIMFVQLLAGAMWAGFSLVTLNFVYGASSEADRPANIAHLFVVNGLAAAGGNLLGGVIAPLLPPVLGYNLLTLFALSGILRGMASFTLLRGVREREKESAPREPVVV